MQQIQISDIQIDIVRKKIKNIHLSVYPPNGRVRLAAPLNIDDEAVRLFVISKLNWIKKHQRQFLAQERQSPRELISRESHYFEGRRYLLKVIEEDAPPKILLKTNTYMELYIRPNSSTAQRQSILNAWYRQQLKLQIPPLIEKWEKIIGVSVADWGVKQMKTKWGTCNTSAKRIWLNLELAKKPPHCLEYVVVHEMTHLLERLHNAKFFAHLDSFMPKWKQYQDELNRFIISHGDWD